MWSGWVDNPVDQAETRELDNDEHVRSAGRALLLSVALLAAACSSTPSSMQRVKKALPTTTVSTSVQQVPLTATTEVPTSSSPPATSPPATAPPVTTAPNVYLPSSDFDAVVSDAQAILNEANSSNPNYETLPQMVSQFAADYSTLQGEAQQTYSGGWGGAAASAVTSIGPRLATLQSTVQQYADDQVAARTCLYNITQTGTGDCSAETNQVEADLGPLGGAAQEVYNFASGAQSNNDLLASKQP